ncbi:AraC family transcriptional regulator [Bradyrhizobium betae]|uniref:Helix-turn-helix transcriptional regulator n=1 Tax=Bradyrhizobium betae TaxID=244734 RepID=A0A5P6PCM4_9BRAD|nr:AraC family transcriptional regulator [Bradyrhizobium betae]MCS3729724.1 AraC-like DNA-binding protein [Bradyrhizobium betae]QFI76051.1 helix-turn-helix transcriptional regulator [Bradyrhizobium betae]
MLNTDVLPPEDRLAVWVEDLGAHDMRLEIEPRDAGADELGRGDFVFSWIGPSAYRIVGKDAATPPDTGGGILLCYGPMGSSVITGPARLTNVRLDGALVRNRMPDIDARLLRQLPSDNIALRLLQAYVEALAASGIPADRGLAHGIHEHIVDLMAASLRPGDDDVERAAGGTIAVTRLAAAKTDIRTHLADPTLSARQVAQRLGLSERSIYLLFERGGLGFSSFVTDERLKRATAMLLDPARQQQRIGDIALAAGFGDLSTFNRSFRRRYGRTPSSLRRPGADHPAPDRTD